jgi:hypothetical protein
LQSDLFGGSQPINIGKLLCGSEALCIYNRGYFAIRRLPPTNNMVVTHFTSIQESLEAVMIAMKHHLYTCEMIDDTILDCTKTIRNKVKQILYWGTKAIMLFEVASHLSMEDAENQANALIKI